MADLHTQISLELTHLVEVFSQPFPSALEPDGWCERTWVKWGEIFAQMKAAFLSGSLPPDASIARALDFDGIVQGEILEKAARLSNLIRDYRGKA